LIHYLLPSIKKGFTAKYESTAVIRFLKQLEIKYQTETVKYELVEHH